MTNNIFKDEDKHTIINVMYCADVICDEEPKVMEPDKVYGWKWFEKNALPVPLFLPIQIMKDNGFFD